MIKGANIGAPHRGKLIGRVTRQVAKLPQDLWPAIAAHWANPQFYKTAIAYLQALPATMKEMQTLAPLRDVPTTVILARESNASDELAFAHHIRAERAGHWIHLDEPELVLGVVREMVGCEVAYLAR
jgi:pimeloyl-ACP methyl ester carboxylesterase